MIIHYHTKYVLLKYTLMKYEKILQKIGLSERESHIYIHLLENGLSTISDIAKRTGLHRPVIYQTLPTLEESGLVSRSQK